MRHIPSGLIVTIGDSKSQLQNKEKAWTVLKSRLYQIELEKQQAEHRAGYAEILPGARHRFRRDGNVLGKQPRARVYVAIGHVGAHVHHGCLPRGRRKSR